MVRSAERAAPDDASHRRANHVARLWHSSFETHADACSSEAVTLLEVSNSGEDGMGCVTGPNWRASIAWLQAAARSRRWPARMLLVSANQRRTVWTFLRPRTVNCCRPQLRKRALIHSAWARRL